jgi:hypothetical protein
MELETTIKMIGCLVVALIIFAIPCLTTLAFVLNWDASIKFLFTIFSIGVIVAMASALYGSVD